MVPSFCHACLITSYVVQAGATEYMKNIGYLGTGYDLIKGNPHANSVDPGFAEAIVDLQSYTQNQITPDRRFYLPDNTAARDILDCSYSSSSTDIRGAKSLSSSLQADVTIDGSAWESSFSVSADYQHVMTSSNTYHNTYVSVKAMCAIYEAYLEAGMAPRLQQGFRNLVNQLPPTADPKVSYNSYWKLIEAFGTHYTSKVNLGSKAVLRSEFAQVSWSRMESSSFDVNAAAKASFWVFSGSVSMMTKTQQKMAQQYESNRTSVTENILGARPSKDGNWQSWLATAGADPMPFAYTLASISGLLNGVQFPDDPDIRSKQATLNAHLQAYCGQLPNCVPNPTDPPDVGFEHLQNQENNNGQIQCPLGKDVVSCGMAESTVVPTEPFWNVYPLSRDTCHCYDYFGDNCYATCVARAAANFTTVEVTGTGTRTASCPSGQKVTGCGIKNSQHHREKYPDVYPSSETTCTCYNYYGATCYATCSANVGLYRIMNNYGTGHVDVQCPAETFALGCGMRDKTKSGPYEIYPGFWPKDLQTCRCYNYFGTTCYAICGTITSGVGLGVPISADIVV